MTNYEWLCKEGKLADFIVGLRYDGERGSDFENCASVLLYHINLGYYVGEVGQATMIAAWLQAEHPEIYVRYTDVLELIASKFKELGRLEGFAQKLCDELTNLDTKEI